MSKAITGGCLCGAVRFRTEAEVVAARACWCRVCQYLASGNAAINVILPVEGMDVTGPTQTYESVADSGSIMRRRFCPACGTPLFSQSSSRPTMMVVRVGALDDRSMAGPQSTIWTDSAPAWGFIDPDCPTTPGQPG